MTMAWTRNLALLGFGILPALGQSWSYPQSYSYPRNCTYGPHSRGCWRDGFDILSDYTNNSVIPPGKVVEVGFSAFRVMKRSNM
jgi:hypothetical protein